MDSNGAQVDKQSAGDGNGRKVWVSDDQTDGDGDGVAKENSGLLKNDEAFSPRATTNQKRNGGLLKKSGHKFVAAIKSLQCSPRVEGEYGKLEEQKKKPNSKKHKNNEVPPHSSQEQNDNPQPIFIANFDGFQQQEDKSPPVETRSVSKNLELEKVLVRLDSMEFESNSVPATHNNDLEIFTNNTDETNDTIDTTENDRKSDIVQDLWNLSGRPPQQPQHQIDATKVSSGAFPLSEWEEPTTPTRSIIQQEFSHYSNDSNDTPLTCNKSLIMTPKNERPNIAAETNTEDDFYAKPPKELFHHSLALGDSLTPTEDDSPSHNNSIAAFPSETFQNKNKNNSSVSNRPPQQRLEALNLPTIEPTRSRVRTGTPNLSFMDRNQSILRRVQQFEKGFSARQANQPKQETTNPSPSPSLPQDENSPNSSTVSSFVFSTDGLESSKANGRTSASPSFFWKTHPKTTKEKGTPPPQPQSTMSPEPFSPAFFWKTHPRVTTKPYNFQQSKSIVRKVNTKLESAGRHQIAEVAVS